jgi:hypothetical protein
MKSGFRRMSCVRLRINVAQQLSATTSNSRRAGKRRPIHAPQHAFSHLNSWAHRSKTPPKRGQMRNYLILNDAGKIVLASI